MARNRHFGYGRSIFGEPGGSNGHDIKAYGDTVDKYFSWDAAEAVFTIEGALKCDSVLIESYAFKDDEALAFGTGNDVEVEWNGTNLTIAAAADDSLIEIGVSAATQKSFDLKWYANEANGTTYVLADASANKVITAGVGFDIDGEVIVGQNTSGYDVKFHGDTTGCFMMWDKSEDQLIVTGPADVPALKIAGAGSKSAVGFSGVGVAWGDTETPAFVAKQAYMMIDIGGTVYRIPLFADS